MQTMLLHLTLAALMHVALAAAQQSEVVVRITRPQTAAAFGLPEGTFVNGYRSAVSGTDIAYHSSHPDADTALLVRARADVPPIVWETDRVPPDLKGDFVYFLWLAGIDQAGWGMERPPRRFTVSINGEPWFTFRTQRDTSFRHWTSKGRDGGELSFHCTMVDRVSDLFGTMVLKMPSSVARPGTALRIEVKGEDAASSDWYMTFKYSFRTVPLVRMEPVLLRTDPRPSQMLRVSLDNLVAGSSVDISVPGRPVYRHDLEVGGNVLRVPIDSVSSPREIPLRVFLGDKLLSAATYTITPVVRREVHILPYSHNDIGYTDLQTAIERKQWSNIDHALRLIAATDDYPPDARFRWNMETIWALDTYLRQAPAEKRQAFFRAVRLGRIGLNALYANVLTGLASMEEMRHFTEFAGQISKEQGIAIPTATVSDIPGFTWGIVPALAQSGVRYFGSAPNPFDRIGHTLSTWGDKPFYWVSQSGQDTVLMWVAGASYASFHEGDLSRLGDEKLWKLLRTLDDRQYPYDMVYLPYTTGGDNGPPDSNLSTYVKGWNERYASPRLIISTHRAMFEEFEQKYGKTLKTYGGDFTPYWEDGAASSAREVALGRTAADRLIQSEALWSVHHPAPFPDSEYYEAWRQVILWDEHTWGAYNSISEPDGPLQTGQWELKKRFAEEGDRLSKVLMAKASAGAPAAKGGIDVFNSSSWLRTDLVVLTPEQSTAGDKVVDDRGKVLPSQRLVSGGLAVLVENVPPLSARRLFVHKGKGSSPKAASASGTTIATHDVIVTVDPLRGAITQLRKGTAGMNFAGTHGPHGLNQYLYVAGKNADSARSVGAVHVSIRDRGPLVASLLVEATAPGCKTYSTEIRVAEGLPRVDIVHHVDRLRVREKEGVHIAFPFDIPNGVIRYDVASGIVRPERDQLPGACKNFFTLQSWVDLSDEASGATLASVDAPLIEIGAITAELPWLTKVTPGTAIYSYVMNNYWHTNYKADQEGPVDFRYSIRFHGVFKSEEAARFGRELREPFAVFAAVGPAPVRCPFTVDGKGIMLTSIRPDESQEGWVVRLYNPAASSLDAGILWRSKMAREVWLCDGLGNPVQKVTGKIAVPAYGNAVVRMR